ncbi:hypothetical protein GON03_02825 [Nocardioides sp. MAH-18]|uniref:DUF11 domain-containing protein n=1 Tax=Nocardioides agri TaxID=2682843 RepID=A0A6L6XLI1_9ACTN|nr:sortase [Nocardioides sp. CGMCC 1.13656]MBA2953230.1 hypothetical protein [Nocardioides sp. CGMCC 1.13656]MVQ48099.1 hypothetical protein [Nocardioides sp. MAH-18]
MKWRCGSAAFLFQSPNGSAPDHLVQAVDLVTGAVTNAGTTVDQVNAVSYNTADDFMYGWDLRTDTLVRISADLSLVDLRVPANTPASHQGVAYNVGDFDGSGNLWLMDNQSGKWLRIDMSNPDAPRTTAVGTADPPANLLLPGDWAFVNGLFWGVAPMVSSLSTNPARLVSFSPTTRTFTNRGILPGMKSGSTFGAVYSDDTYLYVSRNQDGGIYRVTPTTNPTNIFLSDGPSASSNDGARCRSNVIPTVTITKQVAGRHQAADQFDVRLLDASGATETTVATTGTQTTVTSLDRPVERGATYVIADWLTLDSPSLPSDYTGSLSCVTEDGGVSVSPPVAIATWPLTIGTANDYRCTVTNAPTTPAPRLTLAKSVSPVDAGSFTAGEVLTYSFVVTNTGNVPVSGITVTETSFSGAGTPPTPACPVTTLIPRAFTTCTATYTVQAADVLAGTITNTAQASGNDPGGAPVVSNNDDAQVPAAPAPALSVEKTALPPIVVKAGEVVGYLFTVTNTGNVAVNSVAIAEDSFNGTGGAISVATCDRTTLVPGQRALCRATYAATQADVDRGTPLVNTAHATGTVPGGGPVVSPPDNATVPVHQSPELSLVKEARSQGTRAGDAVDYRFTVTNTGNTTVSGLVIAEDQFSGTGAVGPITCAQTTLAPGASTTCTARYALTRADVGAGFVSNTAHAGGADPQGTAVVSGPATAVISIPQGVRVPPRIITRTTDDRVTPGEPFRDRVRIRGLVRGTEVQVTARLYGPFASRADARCRAADEARSVSWRAGNGWSRSPAVRVQEPGVYSWRVTTRASGGNAAGRHACGLKSETTTVAKPAYAAPVVNGGYSGTLLPGHDRKVLPVVKARSIGLRAAVLATGVTRGSLPLPADVGRVAWLRRSAGYGDAIGATVIAGHVSDRHDRPGAMWQLSKLHRGQRVAVAVGKQSIGYRVARTLTFERGRRLPARFFSTLGPNRLVLISCTDRVVTTDGHFHYARYQVVVANRTR